MDWNQPKLQLQIRTGDLNYLGKVSSGTSNWKTLRSKTLNYS